ncbi:putative UDP-glucuronate:xylan alpha-glucuronosyltransferase 3 isoform X1 [Elaeis guineensis]|uniref:Hexosyltransferase n=2 Tax=Elaeis guineensis var. tenera TaxID=51953 RepID=A0A6I9QLS4_ELAGV|nr:putative UDP-glucuronate:xylan alpha-glucuronosyltransferase 3 isoform X1 [Elaeis guineensis]
MRMKSCADWRSDEEFSCCGLIGERRLMGASPGNVEARHRSAGTNDDENKRRTRRSRVFKEVDKFSILISERSSSCKFHSLKLVLVIIICGTILTLLYSPAVHNEHHLQPVSRPGLVDLGWLWDRTISDSRYISHLDVDWAQIPLVIEQVGGIKGNLKIGLLNFNTTEISYWQQILPWAKTSVVHLDYANSNLTWEVLYPEWIDEEEQYEVPVCPSLPAPEVPRGSKFDLVAVKLPCNRLGRWSRDVARLHLQLAAAKLASASAKHHSRVHVLFVTDCLPIPNLFTCKDLVKREGNLWLYTPNLRTLKEKLRLPVGSCELALPLKAKVRPYSKTGHREAYATILHSAHVYVCGAITAAQSIRLTGSTRDLVILVDETISDHHRSGLEAAGWKVKTIQRIRNPKAERDAYNEWNYSKFRLWQLTEYDKIIFIDADLLILRNIDFLFTMPEITATGNNATLFNSGVMVVEPSNCTFQLLMEHINEIESYNGGDQGYLNEIFTWWHRIPKHMNFLKHFWEGDEESVKAHKTDLFGADPPVLYVLHYLGLKPWLCFRDYDCNWNEDILREFASDVAHARWWKVHDTMPEKLQHFCLLRSKQKAALEWDRRQAEKAKFPDGHWKQNITDPRLHICFEEFCFWESMLWHWGETNWTDNSPVPATPTAALPSL